MILVVDTSMKMLKCSDVFLQVCRAWFYWLVLSFINLTQLVTSTVLVAIAVDRALKTRGAGIAQRLEHQTRDRKVVGLNPCRSGGRIFFSRVSFLCCKHTALADIQKRAIKSCLLM